MPPARVVSRPARATRSLSMRRVFTPGRTSYKRARAHRSCRRLAADGPAYLLHGAQSDVAMHKQPAVLIVGAGPTGLVAAIEAVRRGAAVRVIDRDMGPTALSKAVGVSAHSLELLEPSGATERLLADGIKIRHATVWFERRPLARIDTSNLQHRFDFLLSLPQHETENVLASVLAEAGVTIEWDTRLKDVVQSRDLITARFEGLDGDAEASFDYVYGADGVHSVVRDSLGLPYLGHQHRRTWSIADAVVADWPYEAPAAHLFMHPNGDLGFVIPIGTDRHRFVANTPDAIAQVPGSYRVTRVLRADTFPIPVRQAADYQTGRAFLGGDAAHVQSPVGARGMNLGIEDAAAFARRLADGTLDGYTRERRPVGRRWLRLSEHVLDAAQATHPAFIAARNLVFRVFGKSALRAAARAAARHGARALGEPVPRRRCVVAVFTWRPRPL